jgi:ABC-2 type transport system permease protein
MQINMPMIFPALLLSGILWPVEALPDWLQPVAWALPTTWTAEACRSIMVRGWGLESEVIWMAFLANAIFAGAMLLIAARTLRVRA